MEVGEFAHADGEVGRRAALGDLDLAPGAVRIEEDEQVGGAVAPVFADVALDQRRRTVLERSINGLSPEARAAVRRKDVAPLVNDLIDWMKRERGKLSRHNEVAKAFDYMLKRIDVFTRFIDDGRICLT